MLSQLTVKNFAIAKELDVQWHEGMTVLSGETGAGKSIILDALGLTLGDRADSTMVRNGEDRAEISAVFELPDKDPALEWLIDNDLDQDQQCILRRVVTAEGRSRAYLNGQPCSLAQIKELGERLIDIHSQHEHQSLLQKENHRGIIDNYGQLAPLAKKVSMAYSSWQKTLADFLDRSANIAEFEAKSKLLAFQLEEFDQLALAEGEIEALEDEQKRLSNSEDLITGAGRALNICQQEETNLNSLINSAINELSKLVHHDSKLKEASDILSEAAIQVDEASRSLEEFLGSFDLDPERLAFVEERLSTIYALSRKHGCHPRELTTIESNLRLELASMDRSDETLGQLEQEAEGYRKQYVELARQLFEKRTQAAVTLKKDVAKHLKSIEMANVVFEIECVEKTEEHFSKAGIESIEFLVSTNPGNPPLSLSKVASGGELSRLSLAIQVAIAKRSRIPTLVFDEVDVGIGGGTAQIVGRLLRQLGSRGQVICVTHLPQVASQGHHHKFISKAIRKGVVSSAINDIDEGTRVEEIARMLGGVDITEQTLAHAKEMLSDAAKDTLKI